MFVINIVLGRNFFKLSFLIEDEFSTTGLFSVGQGLFSITSFLSERLRVMLAARYFLMFFWLEPKEPKVQEKTMRSAVFSGQRTKTPVIDTSPFYLYWIFAAYASCFARQLEALIFRLPG